MSTAGAHVAKPPGSRGEEGPRAGRNNATDGGRQGANCADRKRIARSGARWEPLSPP